MSKLGKRRNNVKHTIEAYGCYCNCYVGCFCSCDSGTPTAANLSYQGQGAQIQWRSGRISSARNSQGG